MKIDYRPEPPNRVQESVQAKMRQFGSGATRHTDEGKLAYEGFLDPRVLTRYAQYMHENRVQADGQLRAADNWQKGIPPEAYMDSLVRHIVDAWTQWRVMLDQPEVATTEVQTKAFLDALCAVLFNTMGIIREVQRRYALS